MAATYCCKSKKVAKKIFFCCFVFDYEVSWGASINY